MLEDTLGELSRNLCGGVNPSATRKKLTVFFGIRNVIGQET